MANAISRRFHFIQKSMDDYGYINFVKGISLNKEGHYGATVTNSQVGIVPSSDPKFVLNLIAELTIKFLFL